MANELKKGKLDGIREAVAANRQRSQLIESLGDSEIDWLGFDTEDIVEYLESAIDQKRADQWLRRMGSKSSLLEHISGYRKKA